MIASVIQFIKNLFGGTAPAPSEVAASKPPEAESPVSAEALKPTSRQKAQTEQTAQDKNQKPRWTIAEFEVPPEEGKTRFHDFNLSTSLMHAIADLEFRYCSPIQAEILPHTLLGKDAIGQAQTGTGKTAAFLISIFSHMQRRRLPSSPPPGTPRALILAPTRELVLQIGKDAAALSRYTRFNTVTLFGGMDYQKQQRQLEKRVDVIVATPGRLLDFQQRQILQLGQIEILVLDEADRMLDMGFIPDVRRIVYTTPHKNKRQTLFFSATFTDDVERLASSWTRDAVRIQVEPDQVAADTVQQLVYIVTSEEKYTVLYNLITQQKLERVMVFTNRRDETRRLTERLQNHGIRCAMLSGDVPQAKRGKTLDNFRNGKIQVLVATDVAGRGIHVDEVSHVINYTLPTDPEDYVHRIGRTGRAGNQGISISFACEEDAFQLPDIQDFLGQEMHCIQPEEALLQTPPKPQKTEKSASSNHSSRPPRQRRPRRSRRSPQASGR